MPSSSVNYKSTITNDIGSTPTLIFGSEKSCSIESIWIVNTTQNSLFVDITILREIDNEPKSTYIIRKLPITAYGKQEIINANIQNNVGISSTPQAYYTLPGDTMFANSDFIQNRFECHVNYREFVETGV